MKRTDAARNIGNLFAPGGAGIMGTVVDYTWLNGIQETLANAIIGMGAALDPDSNLDLYNVLKAIQTMAAGGHLKGVVANVAALPSAGNTVGDTWDVTADPTPANNVLWICSVLPNTWNKVFALPDLTGYVQKAGGTMTGLLILSSIQNLFAAQVAGGEAYDSGWFNVAKGTAYTMAHGLGAIPTRVTLLGRKDDTASGYALIKGASYDGAKWRGCDVAMDGTDIYLNIAPDSVSGALNMAASGFNTAGGSADASGQYRIIAEK